MKNKNSSFKIVAAVFIIVLAIGVLIFLGRQGSNYAAGQLDSFAQCLASKGATMYGAYWCPHCQNQKVAFGDSFKYVSYVECTQDAQRCVNAGIEGYPTWVLAGGQRLVGEQSLQTLSRQTGCPLPDNASNSQQ